MLYFAECSSPLWPSLHSKSFCHGPQGFPIHSYVIMYVNDSGILFYDLVYVLLVHILGHLEAKCYPQEIVMAKVCVESYQEGRLMVKVYWTQPIKCIQFRSKAFESDSLCATCSNIGTLWCSWMKVFFKSLGSIHTHMSPFALIG